jgi:NAD(P)-dependent dehydrogenase (short-subunit alcohol dehydrogenase family)
VKGGVSGKACLVTGAATGIGRATALAAAARGARLVLTDIQAEALERTAAEADASGAEVLHSSAFDITDREAVTAFAAEVGSAHGGLDMVMNVAGKSTWGPVERLSHEDWREMVEIDLMGPINVIEAFIPPMIEAGRGGHLVNVSSAAGLFGLPWHAAYSAAKFGLRGVSEVLRFDLGPQGIGVTLVCPGAVDTPLVDTLRIVGVDRTQPAAQKMAARFRSRAVSPDEVARRILDAVERNRYLVFTSREIHALYLLQRYIPPAYELMMRRLNRRFLPLAEHLIAASGGDAR